MEDVPQPGSLEAEAGVFCSTFDMTGTRLITGGADKTIKVCSLNLRLCSRFDSLHLGLCGAVAVVGSNGVSYGM
jgi:pleiotropic regulator 1